MSGTGSLLIRNLRKTGDYDKATKAQDELLRIAIANDANIASARKSYYKGEIPPLSQEQDKDPAELQADQAKQEADLIRNLQSLGFRFADIQKIVGSLTPDIEFKVNQTFPQIKRRLEKDYNPKLITPSFFLDFLTKYLETLDRSRGFISGGSSTKPSASSKFDLGGGDEAVEDIGGEEEVDLATAEAIVPREPSVSIVGKAVPIIYESEAVFQRQTLAEKKRFLKQFLKEYRRVSAGRLSEAELEKLDEADMIIRESGRDDENMRDGGVLTAIYGLFAPDVLNRLREVGSSLIPAKKEGEGMFMRKKGLKAIKIGKGVVVEEQPQFRPLGKYLIHYGFLADKDMLNVKYPSGGSIPQFKPTPISDIFKDFVIDLLDNGKANSRIYDQLPIDERKLFEKVATGAGIFHSLKLKKTLTNTDKEEADRFELLKGEYLAGNNSPKVLQELRRLVVKFMNDGRLHKTQGINFLMELSI